jgi:hypothetical protein
MSEMALHRAASALLSWVGNGSKYQYVFGGGGGVGHLPSWVEEGG